MPSLADLLAALRQLLESPSPVAAFAVLLLAVPLWMVARVVRRAGFSPWWVLLALVPVVNLIALWAFAFVRWPAVDRRADGG